MRERCSRGADSSALVARAYRGEVRSRRVLNAITRHVGTCERCRRLAEALVATYGPTADDAGGEA